MAVDDHSPRQAPERDRAATTDDDDVSFEGRSPRVPTGRVVFHGVGAGLAIGLIVFFLVATPIYMVRAIDLAGDARTFVRNGVLRGALPAGLVSAVVGGATVARWRWRGGRMAASGRRDFPGVIEPPAR